MKRTWIGVVLGFIGAVVVWFGDATPALASTNSGVNSYQAAVNQRGWWNNVPSVSQFPQVPNKPESFAQLQSQLPKAQKPNVSQAISQYQQRVNNSPMEKAWENYKTPKGWWDSPQFKVNLQQDQQFQSNVQNTMNQGQSMFGNMQGLFKKLKIPGLDGSTAIPSTQPSQSGTASQSTGSNFLGVQLPSFPSLSGSGSLFHNGFNFPNFPAWFGMGPQN